MTKLRCSLVILIPGDTTGGVHPRAKLPPLLRTGIFFRATFSFHVENILDISLMI